MTKRIRIATRGSRLARAQSLWVGACLERLGRVVELVVVSTRGDRIQDRPLAAVGGKGLFVKEVEATVLDGTADLAVHSMKDMPAEGPEGLVFAAVPKREDPRDCLVTADGLTFEELPTGAVLGSSSLRRRALARQARPDLEIRPIRGNVETRLAHVGRGDVAGVLLACAGLNRLELSPPGARPLATSLFLPAAGQGALAVQAREGSETAALLAEIHDPDTGLAIEAERAFLALLGGSCHVPCGALARVVGERIDFEGFLAGIDGSPSWRRRASGDRASAASLGRRVAEEILSSGGEAVLAELEGGNS